MHEEGQPLWKRVFGNSGGQEREGKALAYISHRLRSGASLEQAINDGYVRRNLSRAEVDEVVSDPELLRAVRERMESNVDPERRDPGAPSAGAGPGPTDAHRRVRHRASPVAGREAREPRGPREGTIRV